MARTPDRRAGPLLEEEIQMDLQTSDPSIEGAIRYVSGSFRFLDSTGLYDPRTGGGLTENAHKTLRQLIHFIDDGPAEGFTSGAYKEVIGGAFPTSIIWWESSSKLKKIVEKTITRSGGSATLIAPTPIVWQIYDTDGSTVLATVSDAITYSGAFEVSRTRTIS